MATPFQRPEPAERGGRIGVLFFLFSAVLIYGVFVLGMPISQARIEDRQHRDLFLLAVGVLVLITGFTASRRGSRTRDDRIVTASAIALPCYALFQIVPLPVGVVGLLSPVRAELVRALTPITGPHRFASISIVPAATFTHLVLISAYCAIFFAAWEFADRAREKAWVIAAPVVLAAAAEAILGLLQMFSGHSATAATGTYTIRNHFAGLLELALPFPAMYTLSVLRQSPPLGYVDPPIAGRVVAGAVVTALLMAGVLFSLSRGGSVAALASVLVMVAVATNWNMPLRRKIATACLFCVLAGVAIYYLTPISLVARLSQHNTAGRFSVWSEGIGIVGQYPLVGCGLGGFESAFLRFKTVEGSIVVDYAHNDYLQLLAELGIAGMLAIGLLFASVSRRVTRIIDEASDIRWVGLACIGSLTAIVVHSAFDFNLYVAANAAVLAWICGLATGLRPVEPFPVVGTIEAEAVIERESASPRRPMPFP